MCMCGMEKGLTISYTEKTYKLSDREFIFSIEKIWDNYDIL